MHGGSDRALSTVRTVRSVRINKLPTTQCRGEVSMGGCVTGTGTNPKGYPMCRDARVRG